MRRERRRPASRQPASGFLDRLWRVVAIAPVLAACQTLLPETAMQTRVEWETFDQARAIIESLEPYKARKVDVAAKGIDPRINPAVSLLTFSEVLQRFGASSAIRPEDFDPGIRECLTAGKRCTAYSIQASRVRRERVGNFWLDSLNFRREVDVTGWRFNALVIMVDDLVVYTLYGGQPNIREKENIRNPLGPLQGWGEQVPAFIR